jgi:hypothetical protein
MQLYPLSTAGASRLVEALPVTRPLAKVVQHACRTATGPFLGFHPLSYKHYLAMEQNCVHYTTSHRPTEAAPGPTRT